MDFLRQREKIMELIFYSFPNNQQKQTLLLRLSSLYKYLMLMAIINGLLNEQNFHFIVFMSLDISNFIKLDSVIRLMTQMS